MSLARRYIEQAAKFIDEHPERFDFWEPKIPRTEFCSAACALAWGGSLQTQGRGFFARLFSRRRPYEEIDTVARSWGFMSDDHFYNSMDRVLDNNAIWRMQPDLCAKGMRKLAEEIV